MTILTEVNSNIPNNSETMNESSTNCESWARHILTFLRFLYKDMELSIKIGFGTLLNYLDYVFYGNGKSAEFVAKYSRVHVSKELSQLKVNSFELITWFFPTLDYHLTHFGIITTMDPLCTISFFEGNKAEKCQNSMEFRESHKQCCDSFTFESLNMTNLLLVIRECLQPPTYYLSQQEVIERQRKIKMISLDKVEPAPDSNPTARIFACDFADEKGAIFHQMINCTSFHR